MKGSRTTPTSHPEINLLAGPSGSGKSTLAKQTAKELGIEVLSLDDYFIRGARKFIETATGKVRNFEAPELYDGAGMARDVQARRACVVEGFCLFTYPEILGIPGLRFYIDVPFATCIARRRARKPSRPSDRSFEIIGEAETRRVVEPQRNLGGVTVVDGTQPIEAALEVIRQRLRRAI